MRMTRWQIGVLLVIFAGLLFGDRRWRLRVEVMGRPSEGSSPTTKGVPWLRQLRKKAAADAWEKKVNDYTIANLNKGIEDVFR